ncbi:MAG: NUDIX hydrolase [Clostridiales bacterium]|nr:NUDIX hydrolase [Clostridiales bacterium]
MDDTLRETYLSGKEVFHGKIIRVEHWQVALPNGKEALREVVVHNGAAAIVPVDEAGNVTLVRQHRVAAGRFTWEIPAGKLDTPDEDPFFAAKRELEEETGLRAENWQLLTRIDTTPGFCTEKIALYLATGLSQHETHPDADEFLHLTKIPLDEAVALCMKGELRDSKTVIGLMMAQRALAERARLGFADATTIQRGMAAPSSPAMK